MKKQGWKETGGIGKTLQGRSEPVKVKYKFDGYGIGHDQAEHHKFKWWERAFETAAASIEVGDDNKIQKTGKGGPVVSTTMPISKALNKAMLYGRFIKRGVMKGGKVEALQHHRNQIDSDSDSDDETTKKIKGAIVEISDAELFKRCGGLTGHKGARHGHTMNAKIDRLKASEEEGLKRLAEVRKQQEERKKKENLDQWEDKIYGTTEANSSEISEIKKKKKKNRLEEPISEDINANTEEQASNEETEATPKKKKKKKRKLEVEIEETLPVESEEKPKKKMKKKNKMEENASDEGNNETVEVEETPKKKKKKKSKNTEVVNEEVEEDLPVKTVEEVASDEATEKTKKKKKKKKKEE